MSSVSRRMKRWFQGQGSRHYPARRCAFWTRCESDRHSAIVSGGEGLWPANTKVVRRFSSSSMPSLHPQHVRISGDSPTKALSSQPLLSSTGMLELQCHSTAANPALSALWKNLNALNYRASLMILDVEADILSKNPFQ
jgi:hypothetical protein